MPYITSQEVAQKRAEIKKRFPQYKFSIVRQHYSTLSVTILSGPMELLQDGETYQQVNHFYIESNYSDRPEVRDLLLEILSIMKRGIGPSYFDSDYGFIPDYYTHISIGQWDKPYVVK